MPERAATSHTARKRREPAKVDEAFLALKEAHIHAVYSESMRGIGRTAEANTHSYDAFILYSELGKDAEAGKMQHGYMVSKVNEELTLAAVYERVIGNPREAVEHSSEAIRYLLNLSNKEEELGNEKKAIEYKQKALVRMNHDANMLQEHADAKKEQGESIDYVLAMMDRTSILHQGGTLLEMPEMMEQASRARIRIATFAVRAARSIERQVISGRRSVELNAAKIGVGALQLVKAEVQTAEKESAEPRVLRSPGTLSRLKAAFRHETPAVAGHAYVQDANAKADAERRVNETQLYNAIIEAGSLRCLAADILETISRPTDALKVLVEGARIYEQEITTMPHATYMYQRARRTIRAINENDDGTPKAPALKEALSGQYL